MGMFLRRGPAPHRTRMSDLEIGSSIKLNLNGTPWEWLVVHQGLPSAIYDASCDGTWLLLKDIYENREWHSSNVNDYANSTIHSYLNSTFFALFDSNIQNAINQVKIPYRAGSGYSKTVTSGASGLSTKVFMLSATECAFGETYQPTREGSTISYFRGCSATSADSKRIAYLNGSATRWWTRSPYCTINAASARSLRVNADGDNGNTYCSNSYGIRPAIILNPDFIVTDDMLAA